MRIPAILCSFLLILTNLNAGPATVADETVVFRSPSPKDVFCFSPGLTHGFNGRIIATFDLGGPGVAKLDGPRSGAGDAKDGNQTRVMISDDHGETWHETAKLPMLHCIPFKAGKSLYIIGNGRDLRITRSDDNGNNWSAFTVLDDTAVWHQAPCSIDVQNGRIYLVYERTGKGLPISPVLFSADENADLTQTASWKRSAPFDPTAMLSEVKMLGMKYRSWDTAGILETNLFRIYDSNHAFFDAKDKTVILVSRVRGSVNLAAFLKGVEKEDGSLVIEPLKTPAGDTLFLHAFPGGQLKFQLTYDPVSKLYWLVSTQVLRNLEQWITPESGKPDNQRSRIQLSFSRNGFDWCHAGLIAKTDLPNGSRNYPALLIDGDDLLVLSRSGDQDAKACHDGNLILLHRVRDFRKLAY